MCHLDHEHLLFRQIQRGNIKHCSLQAPSQPCFCCMMWSIHVLSSFLNKMLSLESISQSFTFKRSAYNNRRTPLGSDVELELDFLTLQPAASAPQGRLNFSKIELPVFNGDLVTWLDPFGIVQSTLRMSSLHQQGNF